MGFRHSLIDVGTAWHTLSLASTGTTPGANCKIDKQAVSYVNQKLAKIVQHP